MLTLEIQDLTATVQAFDLGIFTNCYFYDRAGNSWPVVSADLIQRTPAKWRRDPSDLLPVSITFGPSVQRPVVEIINDLLEILLSDNEFTVYLGEHVSITELCKKVKLFQSPAQLIDGTRSELIQPLRKTDSMR